MRNRLAWVLLLCLLLLAADRSSVPAGAQNRTSRLLIAGGTVIDGSGAKRRREDVRIVGDTIQEVGRLQPRPDERVLDARGLIVAPGFIDAHSHADGGLLEMPEAESQIRQGITTAVVGQDGGSHFPLATYFAEVQAKRVALNIASFVGHGTVRREVMGKDNRRPATPEEIARMQRLIEQEMKAGALGLSTGLEYDPGYYATTEEVIACAKAAAAFGGIYISHVRNEDNRALESFQELIRIAQEARLPAQISHIKLGAKSVWGRAEDVLRMMREARRRGLDITADVYPYLYWQSTITVLIPTRDWNNRAAWEKGIADVGGPQNILLSNYTPDRDWAGKTIAEIAAMTGKDPVTVIQEIVRKTHGPGANGKESVVVTAMREDDLRRFIADPYIMFCSDGGLCGTHPRSAGAYPRVLGRYVREQKTLSLEEAIRKMTSLPARRMGFAGRGLLKPGMKADLVVFDAQKVKDTATTAQPLSPPVGIIHVLVNGTTVLEGGRVTGERPGAVIRRAEK